jgi:hypothetical protein
MPALRAHAEECAPCAELLRGFEAISREAGGLHREWSSPHLWPKIRETLIAGSQAPRTGAGETPTSPPSAWNWRPAAAITLLILISSAGLWVFRNTPGRELIPPAGSRPDPLLTEKALDEAERAEATFVRSIENLSRLAGPRLEAPGTSLLAGYREKLLLLDGAIEELRAQLDGNRFNTHLRQELLAIYREKQRTLEQVVREVKS